MAYAADRNPQKSDLGIGVYRDANGESPILGCVRRAEKQLLDVRRTKDYLAPDGNKSYSTLVERLILGDGHRALAERRVCSIQTPGGGGALRAGAELIKTISPRARVWVSGPTWDHQIFVLGKAGVNVAEYPYYDRGNNTLTFARMCEALGKARAGDVVLLHGCCHNPTGEDLSLAQWHELAALLVENKLVPYVDLAYQGFGDGIEEDVAGTRMLAETLPEMLIASSSSKSFGVYRDRAGALTIIGAEAGEQMGRIARQIFEIGCGLYFMPPDGGASTVAAILGDPELRELWTSELNTMRARIDRLRALFREALESESSRDFSFIARQKGMFSLLPLDTRMLRQLEADHSIYMMPEGRINIAAMTEERVAPVAAAIAAVIQLQTLQA
jgi:aspartate aminotransferase